MGKRPVLFCDDGEGDVEIQLPIKWVICSNCQGHGKSSAYLGAFTRDDMDQAGPDFLDEYMSGDYDRTCDRCDGEGKVAVADRSKMSPEHRAAYDEQLRDDRECRAIERMERMMGA